MPQPQKAPTARRLLELLEGRPTIRCTYPDEPPDALSEAERRWLDALRDHLERGGAAVENADAATSADASVELVRKLEQLGTAIGEQLRKLNGSGIFVRSERDRQNGGVGRTPWQPESGPSLTMHVLRR